MSNTELKQLLSALRGYLGELRETGVDGLPFAEKGLEQTAPTVFPESFSATGDVVVREDAGAIRETLDVVRRDLGDCHRCALGAKRTNIVFGVGPQQARVVFVGEAPGRDEDRKGEPFVGEAGRLLTKIIQAMGFKREEVYICNVIKCRPPENRNPLPEEIEACSSFLLRQLKAVRPEVIVALGTFAAQVLLGSREPISMLRGRFHDYHGIPLMPTFHPAFLLRNPAMKREVWDDMKAVMRKLDREQAEEGRPGAKN